MLNLEKKVVSVLLVGILLLSSFMVMATSTTSENYTINEIMGPFYDGIEEDVQTESQADVDAEIYEAYANNPGKGTIKVYVVTQDVKELADFLADYSYKGALGNMASEREELSFLLLELPLEVILKVSELPGVVGVHNYEAPEYSTMDTTQFTEAQYLSGSGAVPQPSDSIGSPEAQWTGGYSGDGVNIAVCDTGVDFSHPDLWGSYAKDEMIFDIEDEIIVSSATAGQNSSFVGSQIIEVLSEALIGAEGELNYELKYRNIIDSSIEIYINDTLCDTCTINGPFITLATALAFGEVLTATYSYYFVYNALYPASWTLYNNGTEMTSGYTMDVNTGKITFTPTLVAGSVITIDYSYYSPYYGWPIAFDPVSMEDYIIGKGKPEGTLYANTSISGTGPFQSSHTIAIDGMPDFSGAEAFNGVANPGTVLDQNFDLKELYATRDANNWYFGFSTRQGITDKSYSIYIDTNGPSSGGTFDPRGAYVDTNSSHSDVLNVVAHNPDGTRVATTSGNIIKIWDVASETMLATMESGGKFVGSMVWTQNGTWLCSANGDTITIWDTSNINDITIFNQIRYVAEGTPGHKENYVLSINENATGTWFAVGGISGDESRIYIFNAATAHIETDFYTRINALAYPESLAYSPDGTMLAAALVNDIKVFQIIDNTTTNTLYTLTGASAANSLAWSPDGSKIVSGYEDGEVMIWDVVTETDTNTFLDHTDYINSVDWSQDGLQVMSAGEDNKLNVWNAGTYASVASIDCLNPINTVNFSSAGGIITGSSDTKVSLWSSTGAYIDTFLSNLPDYVLVVDYIRERSEHWTVDDDGIVFSQNDTIKNTTLYTWNGAGWDSLDIINETIGGEQAYRGFKDGTNEKIGIGFVDLLVPRSLFAGDPDIIDLEMFVTADIGRSEDEVVIAAATGGEPSASLDHGGLYPNLEYADHVSYEIFVDPLLTVEVLMEEGVDYTIVLETGVITFLSPLVAGDEITATYDYYKSPSHPQDTAPSDVNALHPNSDWSDTVISLSNFGRREILYYSVNLPGAQQSVSNNYKFGFHPGEAQILKYGALGILVVDDQTAGVYEQVYVDINNDKVFDSNDIPVYKGSETTYIDSFPEIPDGIPDYSAGTLYFIADGMTAIPYSEVYSERHGFLARSSMDNWTSWRDNYVPRAGDLICLSGEFNIDDDGITLDHGTRTASVIAGRGSPLITPNVTGMAPNASIISISNIDQEGNIFDAWYFAVEGYDGVPGTGDEAVLVNNGFNYNKIYEDGWDPYSRYADYISMDYAEGKSLFVVSSGDMGYGYGTISSPGACPGVLSVGSSTDYYYATQYGNAEGDYPHSGDISSYSSRGPSALGIPKPDVLAPGAGVSDVPLDGDGNLAYMGYGDAWIGTEYSCAATVGVLGLVYQAFYETSHIVEHEVVSYTIENTTKVQMHHHPVLAGSFDITLDSAIVTGGTDYTINLKTGVITFSYNLTKDQWVNASYTFHNEYPDADTARSLLMSGADDTKNDILCQGAGIINAERSIKMAEKTDGILVNPTSWVPGSFNGEEYEAFVKTLSPGQSSTETFSIENRGTSSEIIDIYDATFAKIGEFNKVFSLYVTPVTSIDDYINKFDIMDIIPYNTDMMKVTAYAEFEQLDRNGDGVLEEGEDEVTPGPDFVYDLALVDWNDTDGNGFFNKTDYAEGNTFDVCTLTSNVLQVRTNDPLQRSHDGLFIDLHAKTVMPAGSITKTYYIEWTVVCEFFEKSDWSWLTTNVNTMTIAAAQDSTLTSTLTVPADAGVGSYEGAIYIKHDVTAIVNESVVEYPTVPVLNEFLFNVTIYDVVGEDVFNSTDTEAQLANFPVTGTPELWKSGTILPVLNETVFGPATGSGDEWGPHTLAHVDIVNCTFYLDDSLSPEWMWIDPSEYTLDMVTGIVNFTDYVPYDDGFYFHAYYNYSANTTLVEGVAADYTLDYDTGAVTLTAPLTGPLHASYSWYNPPPATATLSHGYISSCTLLLNDTTVFTDYTLNDITGEITFTPGELGPGDRINASYEWYVPMNIEGAMLDHSVVDDGTTYTISNNGIEITEYTLIPSTGGILFDNPLLPGSNITANYSYYAHTQTIPVMVNIPALKADFSFGGLTTFDVIGETATDVATTQINDEDIMGVTEIPIVDEYVTSVPTYSLSGESLAENMPFDVVDEFVLYSLGGETEEYLNHGSAPSEYITSVTLYADGVPMAAPADYTCSGGGYILFEGAYDPMPAGITITADYTVETTNLYAMMLDHGSTTSGERILPGSYTVYMDGVIMLEGAEYAMDMVLGKVTLVSPPTVPVGSIVTVDYSYYPEITSVELDYGPAPDEVIAPGTYTIYNNAAPMVENTDYAIDTETGMVSFDGAYDPLPVTAVITANYTYYVEVDNTNLAFGAAADEHIVLDSYALVLDNGTAIIELTEDLDYTLEPSTGEIIILTLPGPGEIIRANYSYYAPSTFNRVYSSSIDPAYSFSQVQLNYRPIVEDSIGVPMVIVKKNGVNLIGNGTDYTVDLETGIISFMSLLAPADLIEVDYTYHDTGAILFNNNGMIGGYDGEAQSGDWRFYYMNIPDQGMNRNTDGLLKLYIDVTWNDKPSDIDLFVFGNAFQTTDPGSGEPITMDRYGPYTLENKGGSEETDGFFTLTNTTEDLIAPPLSGGLNVVVLHNVMLNGTTRGETINGEVGWIQMSTDFVETRTTELKDSVSLNLVSNKEFPAGMNVSAVGPASGEVTEVMVVQDNLDIIDNLGFYQGLTDGAGLHKAFKVESALTVEIRCWPVDYDKVPDVDLGICFDANEDGIGQYEELVTFDHCEFTSQTVYGYTPYYASCADWDADEGVTLINPPDGQYVVTILGYTVKQSPQPMNLEIKAIRAGVEGYGLVGDVGEDIVPSGGTYETEDSLPSYEIQTYSMNWDFPGSSADGSYGGVINIGTSTAPGIFTLLASVILDREAPLISTVKPANMDSTNLGRPIISATIEDPDGEIDEKSPRMYLDDVEVTLLSAINIAVDDDSGDQNIGTITFIPTEILADGGHVVTVTVADFAGNEVSKTWGFTVDKTDPYGILDLDSGVTYTNDPSFYLTGRAEPGANVELKGIPTTISLSDDGTFSAIASLSEGDNELVLSSMDAVGNAIEVRYSIFLDTEAPEFDRVVALDGATTNKRVTGVYGEITEPGTLLVDGIDVLVNSDGTFRYESVELLEGQNMLTMEFTDVAGNAANNYMNITLDTAAPILSIDGVESVVNEQQLNLSGVTDADVASLTVNGKLVPVGGGGAFQNSITLSPGSNTIVIESKDRAGNAVQEILTVTFSEGSAAGTNWSAISVMILLAVVGLILGLIFGRMFLAGEPMEEEPPEEDIPEGEESEDEDMASELGDEIPEEDIPEDADSLESDEDLEDMEEPEDLPEGAEPIPVEEGLPEDIPEDEIPEEDIPEDIDAEESDVIDDELSEDGVPEEDIPEDAEDADSIESDGDSLEPEEVDEEPADISDEITSEEEALEKELPEDELSEESDADTAESEEVPEAEEDPRIAKLKEAFESGKISEELYEKNLARFKGD